MQRSQNFKFPFIGLLRAFTVHTASLQQWGYSDNPLCICGDTQEMSHINDCSVNKSEGGLPTLGLHTVSDSAREWLRRVHYIR